MLTIIHRTSKKAPIASVSLDALTDANNLNTLHGEWDVRCHCNAHSPIQMVVKHRRDTNRYYLAAYPDSPLHHPDCGLFRQRKVWLPDVFEPVSAVTFGGDEAVSSEDTVKGASTKDNVEAVSHKDVGSSRKSPVNKAVSIVTPSMMESLLMTLTYNSYSHVHFGNYVSVKQFAEKVKDATANGAVTFPNGNPVTHGLFFGENAYYISRKHATKQGRTLFFRFVQNISQTETCLLVNDKKLSCSRVEMPYTPSPGAWLLFSLFNAEGHVDTVLVYPLVNSKHVIPFQRETQKSLIELVSPMLYKLNNDRQYRFYCSVPLHGVAVEDTHVMADLLVVRKDKKTHQQRRIVIGSHQLELLADGYDAKALSSIDVIAEPDLLKRALI